MEVTAITAAIGTDDFVWNKLNTDDAKAPKPICVAPINAEALPAFFLKGWSDKAAVLGLVSPRQDKKINKSTIVCHKLKIFNVAPATKISVTTT